MRKLAAALVVPIALVFAGSCNRQPATPTPTCTYDVSPSAFSVAAGGGSGDVNVQTASGCAWSATANASWLAITSGASATGPGIAGFTAAPNLTAAARTGTLGVAGQTVTVDQAGTPACTYTLTPGAAAFNEIGGAGVIDVSTASHCAWAATTTADWVQLTSGTPGQGDGAVSYTVARNAEIPGRATQILIGGVPFDVTQSGDVERCVYSVMPVQLDVCMPARDVTTTIATDAACPWTAQSGVPWISLVDGETGVGPATIRLRVEGNYDAPRGGLIMIRWPAPTAGQNVQVAQAGCRYAVTQSAFTVAAGGGSVSFDVLQQSDPITCGGPLQNACVWTAVSNVPWITVVTTMPRTGDDRVVLSVAPYSGSAPRVGQILVRDQIVVVTQLN